MKRKVGLRAKAPMKRGKGIAKKSKAKRAVTIAGLWRVVSRWVVAEGVCVLCGRAVGPGNLDPHHLLTKGSQATLKLCLADIVPVCQEFVGCSGHGRAHGTSGERAEFRAQIEALKPGIYDWLEQVARARHKIPLDEVEAEIDQAVKRPWSEFWASLEVGA